MQSNAAECESPVKVVVDLINMLSRYPGIHLVVPMGRVV